MNSKKINQLATELTPSLSDLTIIGDPSTGISKKITLSQMASLFTGTVEEYANLASFPLVGTADTIYIALDTNIIYRWNTGTSAYVELSPNIVTSLVFSDANGFDGTISLVGSTATLTITTALTQGSVPFIGASGALSQDNANLFFDDTNNRLGVNTNVPTTALDVFGSGIIGRLNGTSTNNAFLGFASAGSNKWSIGNVQSDHRFRIYNEATTSELVSVLQTGEVGIGIANPLTKLHIFGGASALIANLDANTSVAKSISFRSGNSSRINLEVSGTESGSNAGANFFIRTYTDAGSLLATPLTITRSTGAITLAGALSATSATFSSYVTTNGIIIFGSNSSGNPFALGTSTARFQLVNGGIYGLVGDVLTNGATYLQGQRTDGTSTTYNLLLQPLGGNIGVGTTSVLGSSTEKTIHLSDGGGGYATLYITNSLNTLKGIFAIANATSAISIGTQSNHDLRIVTNDTQKAIFTANGEFGIGTTPTGGNRFWVKGNDSTSSNTSMVLQNSSNNNIMIARNDGVVTKPLQPSFRAGRSTSYVPGQATIVFNDTSSNGYNINSAYNSSNGRFTAAVAGRYIFNVCVIWESLSNGQVMDDAFIMKVNGNIGAYSWRRAVYVVNDTGTGGYYTDFGTFSFNLNANDYVEVYNSKSSITVHGNSNYCWFSGYLLG